MRNHANWVLIRLLIVGMVFLPIISAAITYPEKRLFEGLLVGAVIMLVGLLALSAIVRKLHYPVIRFYVASAMMSLLWIGGLTGVYLNQ